jgi:hypothetical protein
MTQCPEQFARLSATVFAQLKRRLPYIEREEIQGWANLAVAETIHEFDPSRSSHEDAKGGIDRYVTCNGWRRGIDLMVQARVIGHRARSMATAGNDMATVTDPDRTGWLDARRLLGAAMRGLRGEYKAVLYLHHVQQYDTRMVARLMRRSQTCVMNWMQGVRHWIGCVSDGETPPANTPTVRRITPTQRTIRSGLAALEGVSTCVSI